MQYYYETETHYTSSIYVIKTTLLHLEVSL